MADDDSEHKKSYTVKLLPYGAREFTDAHVLVDPIKCQAATLKELLGQREGILIHAANIVGEDNSLRNWYTDEYPIVLCGAPPGFEEKDAWRNNANQVARLLNAGVPMDLALVATGRCYWQEGFHAFFDAASTIRQLVDASGTYDYQRRVEIMCMSSRQLNPVVPFNEITGEPMLPPLLRGDIDGGPFHKEWVDVPRGLISAEERAIIEEAARDAESKKAVLQRCSKAVVRVFGYHNAPDMDDPLRPGGAAAHGDESPTRNAAAKAASRQIRVVPFTAFFVAPDLLLASRTACFCAETNTFAHKFMFTRQTRAMHGMLTPGVHLFECTPVADLTDTLVRSVRSVGIALEDSHVPGGLYATPWNDFILFEVAPAQRSETYLLPEAADTRADTAQPGDQVFALGYSERPSDWWLDLNFGPRGHSEETSVTESTVRTQWWGYDLLCAGVGEVTEVNVRNGTLRHTASLLPGTRGGPVLRKMLSVRKDDEVLTYAGINAGRSLELLNRERDNIVDMSTSDLSRKESLSFNMQNVALPAQHLSLVLLYQQVIKRRITSPAHREHVNRFLQPFDIFVKPDLLTKCHQKMLKDAEDHNEYGMDFYDHSDLNNALTCFREGAKMFSTASIPGLTDHQLELKDSLQTNVAAVVVAKQNPRE